MLDVPEVMMQVMFRGWSLGITGLMSFGQGRCVICHYRFALNLLKVQVERQKCGPGRLAE